MKWIVAAMIVAAVWWLLRKPRVATLSASGRARRLLGVGAAADEPEIRAAHRRLMAETHPDRGGSPERARQVNAARDLLLAALTHGDQRR